jgi:hypothetical protein
MEEFDEATALRLFEALEKRPVQLNLHGYNAWVLLSAIQLAWRHPDISPRMKDRLETLGRTIQQAYADAPWVAELAERGWNPAHDVPANRQEEEHAPVDPH